MSYIVAANPFVDAYVESDIIGKLIFILLIALSVISWSILIYKAWLIRRINVDSLSFKKSFHAHASSFLDVPSPTRMHKECPNAFFVVYDVIKRKTMELLEKNHRVAVSSAADVQKQAAYLSTSDMDLLSICGQSAISFMTKYLDKHLYILSTIVTLAPFLGLLGTVYGILVTFSTMQQDAVVASNQVILGGLSLALTTTVIGLIDAIPALVGYNYLKNSIYNFDAEMGRFATDVLTEVEMHYRKVDLH